MRTYVLAKGLQASGKSTWALEEMRKYPDKYKRVNKDLMRKMLDNGRHSPKNEKFINEVCDLITEKALKSGYDVISDNTNLRDDIFDQACAIAQRIGNVRIFEKFFEVTLKEALIRNSKRPESLPQDAIEGTYDRYLKNRRVEVRDSYIPPVVTVSRRLAQTSLPKCIIVDVDGTVALNEGVRDYYDLTKVSNDKPCEDVILLVKDLARMFMVLMVSGREDSCYDDTQRWIRRYQIPCRLILMRKTGDSRPDAVVKKEIYKSQIEPYYHTVYVIDDRTKVVNMWRSLGLCVLQVNNTLV
jgi:predicted kinase